jgi:hypothetical protein
MVTARGGLTVAERPCLGGRATTRWSAAPLWQRLAVRWLLELQNSIVQSDDVVCNRIVKHFKPAFSYLLLDAASVTTAPSSRTSPLRRRGLRKRVRVRMSASVHPRFVSRTGLFSKTTH